MKLLVSPAAASSSSSRPRGRDSKLQRQIEASVFLLHLARQRARSRQFFEELVIFGLRFCRRRVSLATSHSCFPWPKPSPPQSLAAHSFLRSSAASSTGTSKRTPERHVAASALNAIVLVAGHIVSLQLAFAYSCPSSPSPVMLILALSAFAKSMPTTRNLDTKQLLWALHSVTKAKSWPWLAVTA